MQKKSFQPEQSSGRIFFELYSDLPKLHIESSNDK